jgi:pyrimidine-nucleoside phosphorylase
MIPTRVIEAKRSGERISTEDLEAFLSGFLDGAIPDYQMSAFLMAAYFMGLDEAETEVMVRSMLGSGSKLDLGHLDGPRVDKHSTGGVGDKVSLVLAPLAAEVGLFVPMMSGRGLGHTTGTLDKLEAIPGFRTRIPLDEFERILSEVGCAMIGQTEEIAPLDRKLYALRDVTGTVPVIPLIAASIMSKKLAEDLTGLLLDVKVGAGAFIPEEDRAQELATTMVSVGERRGLATVALLTAMDRPLGRAVGNALETAEAIRCLRGEGPDDLRRLTIVEAAEMLTLGAPDVSSEEAEKRATEALDSGRAFERFMRLVEAQGGDTGVAAHPERLSTAARSAVVTASRAGFVTGVSPRALGEGVVALGGGRVRMDQTLDLGVGFEVAVALGDRIERGQPLGTVYARDEAGVREGCTVLEGAITLGEEGPSEARPLVSHRITRDGSYPFG